MEGGAGVMEPPHHLVTEPSDETDSVSVASVWADDWVHSSALLESSKQLEAPTNSSSQASTCNYKECDGRDGAEIECIVWSPRRPCCGCWMPAGFGKRDRCWVSDRIPVNRSWRVVTDACHRTDHCLPSKRNKEHKHKLDSCLSTAYTPSQSIYSIHTQSIYNTLTQSICVLQQLLEDLLPFRLHWAARL